MEFGFHGCFGEVRPGRIASIFTWRGDPDGVALATLNFDDLGDGRPPAARLAMRQSRGPGRPAPRGWRSSGQGYAKLDALLPAGEIAGTAEGAQA